MWLPWMLASVLLVRVMDESPKKRLTKNEWMLIALVVVGILLVALKWEPISKAVIESFRAYFR